MKIFRLSIAAMLLVLAAAQPALAGGDAAAGESKAASCAGCHGPDGKGIEPNPPLVGLDEAYFVEQLKAYKSGERAHEMMQMFAAQLSEEDMADLAAYYASLPSE